MNLNIYHPAIWNNRMTPYEHESVVIISVNLRNLKIELEKLMEKTYDVSSALDIVAHTQTIVQLLKGNKNDSSK